MIPTNTDVVEVTSNITGETGSFTVDEQSLGKIMGVLTNLYSDPELAVVREYLTNALDAQIEAQENDPNYVWRAIEVTLPSRFSKEYKVRDFGTGMSADDLKNIYSKYGKSTKETSNSVTGMLGLGSKCALTYTNQFTITGIKNGIKTIAFVSKDDSDIPTFMIVDTSTTKEANGVEISIPVRDSNSFAEKTRSFLKYWKDGQVLVDGEEPVKHGLSLIKTAKVTYKVRDKQVTGDAPIYLLEREESRYYGSADSYVVMGNVPYLIDDEHISRSLRDAGLGFIAYVPMGSITFPPNREVLTYNPATKKVIGDISDGLFEDILNKKLKDITDAPTHRAAWVLWDSLPRYFATHNLAKALTYKGEAFGGGVMHNHMVLDWDYQGHGQISDRQQVHMSLIMKGCGVIVTGVTQGTKPTSYFKKKVRFYLGEQGIVQDMAYLVDEDMDSVWFTDIPRVNAEYIKNLKLPKNPSLAGPREEAPLEYYTVTGGKASCFSDITITVPDGKTLVYLSPQDMKDTYRKSGTTGMQFATQLGDDYILVVLGKNRFDKFKRNYPKAVPASKVVQDLINAYVAKATDAEYIVGQLTYGEQEFLKKVNPAEIDDPDLSALATLVQSKGTANNYGKAEELHNYARRAEIFATLPAKKTVANTVTKNYPLVEHVGSRKMSHIIIYVNAVYAQI
jgi:hypothetical protein